MRLKEDKSSWNASNVIRKQAIPPDQPRVRPRKNVRKWCKGVVGREHVWVNQAPQSGMFASRGLATKITMDVCQNCGKQNSNTMLWDGKPWNEYWREKMEVQLGKS